MNGWGVFTSRLAPVASRGQSLTIFQFGTAASVGIVAGIVLSMSSSLITTRLGMQDDEQEFPEKTYRPGSAYTHEESSSNEADWAWLSEAASSSRRRAASGLLSQTIHEEDDDSQDES